MRASSVGVTPISNASASSWTSSQGTPSVLTRKASISRCRLTTCLATRSPSGVSWTRLSGVRVTSPSAWRWRSIPLTLGGDTCIAWARLVGELAMPASSSQKSASRYSWTAGLTVAVPMPDIVPVQRTRNPGQLETRSASVSGTGVLFVVAVAVGELPAGGVAVPGRREGFDASLGVFMRPSPAARQLGKPNFMRRPECNPGNATLMVDRRPPRVRRPPRSASGPEPGSGPHDHPAGHPRVQVAAVLERAGLGEGVLEGALVLVPGGEAVALDVVGDPAVVELPRDRRPGLDLYDLRGEPQVPGRHLADADRRRGVRRGLLAAAAAGQRQQQRQHETAQGGTHGGSRLLGFGRPADGSRGCDASECASFAQPAPSSGAAWSRASSAADQPASASSTPTRSTQPVAGIPSSHTHQRSRSIARPSACGSAGQSDPVSVAAAHHASKRPSAAPRRTPCAPPLAAAHAIHASACPGAIGATRGVRTPRRASVPDAPPRTTAARARPSDWLVQTSTRSSRARTTSGRSSSGAAPAAVVTGRGSGSGGGSGGTSLSGR